MKTVKNKGEGRNQRGSRVGMGVAAAGSEEEKKKTYLWVAMSSCEPISPVPCYKDGKMGEIEKTRKRNESDRSSRAYFYLLF